MLSIGQLSELTGVKVPTIRYYEEIGLIKAPERSMGNQRRYTSVDLQRLSFVRHSREMGFTLQDIRQLLDLSSHADEPCQNIDVIAGRHLTKTQSKIAKLRRLEKELKRMVSCDSDKTGSCDVIATLADHGLCETDH